MAATAPLVLVTGSTGYLALQIVKQLLHDGYRVRGTTRDLKNASKLEPLNKLSDGAKYPLEIVQADLLDAQCWLPAVDGCEFVIHTASPTLIAEPDNIEEVLSVAVEGTLNVLRACKGHSMLKRIVLTSSTSAVAGSVASLYSAEVYTEKDWPTEMDKQPTYCKSKVRAEKAAWDFVESLSADETFELSVVHPTVVLGPALSATESASFQVLRILMSSGLPLVPAFIIPVVDVRDVAVAHVKAMTAAEAAGHRHIISGENVRLEDMATILKEEFGPQGYRVPTRTAPRWLLRLLALFSAPLNTGMNVYGIEKHFDNTRMRDVLGVIPCYETRDTIVDMCYNMIELGLIDRTSQYKGRPAADNTL